MLFLRFFWFLLWPLRLPFFLGSRLFRLGRANRATDAAIAGGAARAGSNSAEEDIRYSGLFRVLEVEKSDEPRLDEPSISADEQLKIAESMSKKAHQYFANRPLLFAPLHRGDASAPSKDLVQSLQRDFYEEVEAGFISQITSIDNDGAEDQFVRVMGKGRRLANANARILYCELAPLTLFVLLIAQALLLLLDPWRLLRAPDNVSNIEAYVREGAGAIAMSGIALGVGVLFIAFIYRFSYTHIQRQNAQDLNAFIQNEFSRLNDTFRVAHRECLRAETRVDNTQHSQLGPIAQAWALAYNWIGVRQLMEEFAIRNNMFQIRRNTSLYAMLGVVICIFLAMLLIALACLATYWQGAAVNGWVIAGHMTALTIGFVVISFVLTMRNAFSIFASRLKPDEWNRFDTLAIGKAIAEQVTNDKLQIVIQRDTRR
jgi:hypothetical protein